MTRALLLLTGGRMLPDLIFVKYMLAHWQPDHIFAITTNRGKKDTGTLQQFLLSHFKCNIKICSPITPSDEKDVKKTCNDVLTSVSDAEWVIHFTGAPKTVGIFAYEVAREHNIPYCFLNTDSEHIVFVGRDFPVDTSKLFKASVEEYMLSYGRECMVHKGDTYVEKAQKWYPIAEMLADNYTETRILLKALRHAQLNQHALTPLIPQGARKLVQTLHENDFLEVNKEDSDEIACTLKDDDRRKFLHGDWLEVYVWQKVMQEGFADDCLWGRSINVNELQHLIASNELDISLTYKARLLIAECKTSLDPFESKYLDKLYAISNLIGKDYVRQVFVTDQRPLKNSRRFKSFSDQAKIRNIEVITGTQLPDVGKLLKKEITEIDRSR